MAIYGVAESTNITGKPMSFIYGGADIENGSVVKKGDIKTGEREIYNAEIPALGDEIFFVANPAWSYKSGTIEQNEDQYINKADKPFRVYTLLADNHDRFGVLDYGITPVTSGTDELEPAIGDYIGTDGTTVKLKNLGTTAPTDAADRGFIGKIVDINTYGCAIPTGTAGSVSTVAKMVVIEVIKNETV